MNNTDINAVKEFRRFTNTYIYPDTACLLIDEISQCCDTIQIEYSATPQATIKFKSRLAENVNNTSVYTTTIHNVLKTIFVNHFNNPNVASLIRSKIHTEVNNEELKNILRLALQEIQYGNPRYLGLLFNITILNDYNCYLYL